eukprot:6201675-Pleurochrysis_carterae.AAC.2
MFILVDGSFSNTLRTRLAGGLYMGCLLESQIEARDRSSVAATTYDLACKCHVFDTLELNPTYTFSLTDVSQRFVSCLEVQSHMVAIPIDDVNDVGAKYGPRNRRQVREGGAKIMLQIDSGGVYFNVSNGKRELELKLVCASFAVARRRRTKTGCTPTRDHAEST